MTFLHDMKVEARRRAAGLAPHALAASGKDLGPGRRASRGRSLARALLDENGVPGPRLIAELKRRSPSAGALREDLSPGLLARTYVEAGAAAVSVLTEPTRFGGSLADLEEVARAVEVPVLRKDFLVEEAQIREARDAGADAVLLIVRLLTPVRLGDLLEAVRGDGMEALVEVHDLAELAAALEAGAEVVGVNNRDLATLATRVEHSLELAEAARTHALPWPRVAVSESGIQTREQVRTLSRAGYHAVLVGETLLRAADPAGAVRELLGKP
jgi:indole-3-glycerol phosphate synthase